MLPHLIRDQAGQSVYSRLQVLLVATQVEEGCNLATTSNHFLPVLVLVGLEPLRDELLSLLVKPHDFVADGACPESAEGLPAGLNLVGVVEDSKSSSSSAVVWHALG